MDKWINFGLNLICSTMLENIFLIIITYLILKRHDLIDIHRIKNTLFNILFPAIPVAIILDFFRWIVELPLGIVRIFSIFILYALILTIIKKNSFEKVKFLELKTAFSLLLSLVIMVMIETLYIPILVSLTQSSLLAFSKSPDVMLIVSIPARIIEFSVIAFLLLKKNLFGKINIINVILKNKQILRINVLTLFFNTAVILLFTKFTIYNDILINLNIMDQILVISLLIFIMPCISFLWNIYNIGYLITQENRLQQIYHADN